MQDEDNDDNERALSGDLSLPKACIDRLIKEAIPKDITISNEARLLIAHHGVDFVKMVTKNAHKCSEAEKKKTVTPDHVFTALKESGFENSLDECKKALDNYKDLASRRPSKKNTLKDSGLTMEELIEKQKELFEIARRDLDKSIE